LLDAWGSATAQEGAGAEAAAATHDVHRLRPDLTDATAHDLADPSGIDACSLDKPLEQQPEGILWPELPIQCPAHQTESRI
jgi:hypothetical protein